MGLDATVYCNCFEAGKLREQPPAGLEVFVTENGSLACQNQDLESELAFDQWLQHRACVHTSGVLLHHRISNLALVASLRSELEREEELYPFLLKKVLYNGTHCGDFISHEDFPVLRAELIRLETFISSDKETAEYVAGFRTQMIELLEAAQAVSKPISF